MFEDLGTTLAGYGTEINDWSKANPGQLAWMLGAAGKGLNPKGPLAESGALAGPSLIAANKAKEAEKKSNARHDQYMKLLSDMLSGMTPGVGTPGGNKLGVKVDDKGNIIADHNTTLGNINTIAPGADITGETPGTSPGLGQLRNFSDIVPLA